MCKIHSREKVDSTFLVGGEPKRVGEMFTEEITLEMRLCGWNFSGL